MMIYVEAFGLLMGSLILIGGLIIGLSAVLRQPIRVVTAKLITSAAASAAAGFSAWAGWQAIVVKHVCVISASPTLLQAMAADVGVMLLAAAAAAAVGFFATAAVTTWHDDSWKQDAKYRDYVEKHYGAGAVRDAWKNS